MEERDRILKMVQDHRITAQEGLRLLDILDSQDDAFYGQRTCCVSVGPEVRWGSEWHRVLAQTVARSITQAVASTVRCGVRPTLHFVFGGSRFGV